MMCIKDDFRVYYDPRFDDLTIRKKMDEEVYAEEIYSNLYLYKSDETDEVVGAQILYLSKRSRKVLDQYLPKDIFECVMRKCKEINVEL